MPIGIDAAWRILIAGLGGLAVGVEREWSGHTPGQARRFGGLRTFALLGIVAGMSGWLWTASFAGLAVVLLSGAAALIVVAYLTMAQQHIEATTEVAGIVVLGTGVLAGVGDVWIASAIIAATVLLLVEKRWIDGLAIHLDDVEMRAIARFIVMAVVILPLLPTGPLGPLGGIRPRQLWLVVLFLSGLSFVGFIARRVVGSRGYVVAGLLGGMVSSTSATMTLSNLSRRNTGDARALAAGALGASCVMFPHIVIVSAVLARASLAQVWPVLVAPLVIGGVLVLHTLRSTRASTAPVDEETNPLQVASALKMAAALQVVLYAVAVAEHVYGTSGLYVSASLAGLLNIDAVIISVARSLSGGVPATIAAHAIVVGALSNTIAKMGIVLGYGRGGFRTLAALGLGAMAVALAIGLYWL